MVYFEISRLHSNLQDADQKITCDVFMRTSSILRGTKEKYSGAVKA